MYSLMIVDDEYMILRGMTKILDWDDLGIKIVKTERSPLAALEYLKTNSVDILISDMNMDELAGTKFLPMVKQIVPNIQIIVLSGYADFDYAKTSLEQGVIDYLNKPVDPDELEETLEKTKQILKKVKIRHKNSEIAKQRKIKDILTGEASIDEIDQLNKNYYLLAVSNANDEAITMIKNEGEILGYCLFNNDLVAICTANKAKVLISARKISQFNTVIISNLVTKKEFVKETKRLRKDLEWFHFYGANDDLIELEKISLLPQALDVASMTRELNLEGIPITEFRNIITGKIDLLREHYNDVVDAKYFARLIVMSIFGTNKVINNDLTNAIVKIERTNSSAKLVDLLTSFYADYREETPNYPDAVRKSVKIVKSQYQDQLTLIDVANQLHMSSVYLGALFKKNVGMTFAQYLNSYRVAKSIELMRTSSFDINDIAYQVGYQNTNYFFRVFKKQTKMAPSEYREQMMKD